MRNPEFSIEPEYGMTDGMRSSRLRAAFGRLHAAALERGLHGSQPPRGGRTTWP